MFKRHAIEEAVCFWIQQLKIDELGCIGGPALLKKRFVEEMHAYIELMGEEYKKCTLSTADEICAALVEIAEGAGDADLGLVGSGSALVLPRLSHMYLYISGTRTILESSMMYEPKRIRYY